MNSEDDEYHVFTDVDISDLYDFEFTRLTGLVRQHYSKYLEKQLTENYQKCYLSVKSEGENMNGRRHRDDECRQFIKRTVKILEDKALKACMATQIYQRAMMKIITGVKRNTQEKRLVLQLSKLLNDEKSFTRRQQQKQCEENAFPREFNQSLTNSHEISINHNNHETDDNNNDDDDEDRILGNGIQTELTLDEKIQVFKKKFIEKQFENNENSWNPLNQMETEQSYHKLPKRPKISPQESITSCSLSNTTSPLSCLATSTPAIDQLASQLTDGNSRTPDKAELPNSDECIDEIDLELARIFGDEKTEFDELLGPDDPQISSILKEIENAQINVDVYKDTAKPSSTFSNSPPAKNSASHQLAKQQKMKHQIRPKSDLSKSLWPCELFMLRRKLSETLAYLIDEDYRWLDIIKLEFSHMFGEDSDDEFATYSPSIELDEILIGSCMRRISPWVVKYLMKPLKDGLIANKFLFKKLAKHLTYSIIMENQYPDEMFVMQTIENYFCMHPSIQSANDINGPYGDLQF